MKEFEKKEHALLRKIISGTRSNTIKWESEFQWHPGTFDPDDGMNFLCFTGKKDNLTFELSWNTSVRIIPHIMIREKTPDGVVTTFVGDYDTPSHEILLDELKELLQKNRSKVEHKKWKEEEKVEKQADKVAASKVDSILDSL
jgi:hypothetical protein